MRCMLDLMMWDATDRMELITQPLLLMAGEKADSKYMTDEAMEKATGTNRKELFVIPGADEFEIIREKAYPTEYTPCTEDAKAEKEAAPPNITFSGAALFHAFFSRRRKIL